MTKQKKSIIIRGLAGIAVAILLSSRAPAQIHTPSLPENKWLVLAEDQFSQGHYTNAAQSATTYLQALSANGARPSAVTLDKARFIFCISGLKTSAYNAVDSVEQFIAQTPDPAYRQRTAYALAQYYFHHNQLNEAIPYYEMAGIANLSNKEIANAKFELAYCYFNNQEFDKAKPLFSSIKAYASTYNSAGNYYYGLLAYNQANYKEALESFKKIENEQQYRTIVPYYIAEIYYFTGDRKKALDDALRLIKRSEKSFYDNELHLLAAQVLFEDQRWGDALPYFEHYYGNVDRIRKEDLYEMAYCYYRVNEWKNAIDKFKPLSSTRDSLGQTAMYLLGDCYLKTGDKKSARNAFSICADMPFNPGQQEASTLLSAKLSFEIGYYDAAITYVNTLLANFPGSTYKDEAKTLLSALLIKTSNYTEAYNALKGVTNKDAAYRKTYQRVAYGYGLQQLQLGNINEAYDLLGQSLQYPVDDVYEAATNFWMGDIAYKQQQYGSAVNHTKKFIETLAGRQQVYHLSPSATLHNAYVNLGYASMELQNFEAAQNYFSLAQEEAKGTDAAASFNATLREADAVFMQKDYAKSIALYDKVIDANGEDADYARFQKATIMGLMGKNTEKTALLQSLINTTPPSPYSYDARYELALTYIEADKYQPAIEMLMPLTEAYERRNMAPKAWMKIGFAYQQMNNDNKAVEAYKKVVAEYPTSDERFAALDALKSLFIENNQPAAYAQLLKELNIATPGDNSLDSTFYAAAEAQFATGNKENAKKGFTSYLQQYPNGVFANKANYYKAELHYQLKEYKEALAGYDVVLGNGWSDFSENSAKRAASIAVQNKDNEAALKYYMMLRNSSMGNENLQLAYNGMMQAHYALGHYDEAAAYADTLSSLPGLDETTLDNVRLYKAKALQQFGKNEDALPVYLQLQTSKTNATAAEARYHVAEIYFAQGKYKEAEEAAGNTIKNAAGNDYWIVSSYILLADIMTRQKDYFNAKATLQSIIKNTKIAELKQDATQKLEHVKTLEKRQSKLSEE
jgi:tetratricopeptide (TPR) repeat protein